jgi:predicted oxidoreductase
MNAYAETGVDDEFSRGGTDYQRITAGDRTHEPNPCLGPIRKPPFYAVRLYPGDIGASTGFVTDADARVLDRSGQPIVGLYACGNDMNSVMGGKYPGPGITIGPGLAFAYAAAKHAAGLRGTGG